MKFHGFRSISEYENECARVGMSTRRIPFHSKDGAQFFALITSGSQTATSIDTWHLFTADESSEVLDGIISGGTMDPAKYMRDGLDVNYLGKLATHGYYPRTPRLPLRLRRSIQKGKEGKYVSCSDRKRKALLYSALCCVIIPTSSNERSAHNAA